MMSIQELETADVLLASNKLTNQFHHISEKVVFRNVLIKKDYEELVLGRNLI